MSSNCKCGGGCGCAPSCPKLQDGTYVNASIVVENGCIKEVIGGKPFIYTPEPCCAGSGGGNTDVHTADSGSVILTGNGKAAAPLTAEVRRSSDSGNILEMKANGLFVPPPSMSGLATVATTGTSTVTFTGDGTTIAPLAATTKLSLNTGNQLKDDGTGLFVPDMTSSGGLAAVTTDNSETVSFTGTGTTISKLKATVIVDPDVANKLQNLSTGLFVPDMSASGGLTAVGTIDSDTVAMTGDGTVATRLSASVKLNTDEPNVISSSSLGLLVKPVVTEKPDWALSEVALVHSDGTAYKYNDGRQIYRQTFNVSIPALTALGFIRINISLDASYTILSTEGTIIFDTVKLPFGQTQVITSTAGTSGTLDFYTTRSSSISGPDGANPTTYGIIVSSRYAIPASTAYITLEYVK